MKIKCLLALLCMNMAAHAQTKWLVSQNSSLSVTGSTNINKFTCDIPNCDESTLTVYNGDNEIKLTGSIDPATLSFDCHKKMMTRDLRKTLKAKQYPNLQIRFLSLSKLPTLSSDPIAVSGRVEIEIAGTKKLYTINYQISTDADKVIHLLGSKDMAFSDFDLLPPHKLGGLIKTRDELTVAFHLKMTKV